MPWPAGGERAGVAVGQDPGALRNQRRAVLAHRAVRGQVLLEDGLRLGFEVLGLLHPLQRPEQIDRGRTAFRQDVEAFRGAFAQDHPKGGSTSDRRRAAHDHVADRLGDLGRGLAVQVDELVRKQALVEQLERVALPADRLDVAQTTLLVAAVDRHLRGGGLGEQAAAHLGGQLGDVLRGDLGLEQVVLLVLLDGQVVGLGARREHLVGPQRRCRRPRSDAAC